LSPSSQVSVTEPIPKLQALTVIAKKPGQVTTKYQRKVEANFLKMIAPTSAYKFKKTTGFFADEGKTDVAVQTIDIKFGPKINTEYLLGEVRPWGPRAENLPQKGVGLYMPRNLKNEKQLSRPKSLDRPIEPGEKLQGRPLRL
jgi:hypothetical protein